MELVTRFFQDPNMSFFLLGPRGTGKSLWLKAQFPECTYIDLLDPETLRLLQARPERLNGIIDASLKSNEVIIDEVQRVPELLDVVHQHLSEPNSPRFILSGSSARKLKRSGVDLLSGRAAMKHMHPFIGSELAKTFDLNEALTDGLIPLVQSSENPQAALQAYIDLYIRQEVISEGILRRLEPFIRFLEAVSFSHGQVLNVSEVARESEVNRKAAESFFHILEELLMSFSIPVFAKRAKRILVKHTKFYLFDAGLYRALRPKGPLDNVSEIDGQALEGLVAQHLRAWIEYSGKDDQLYYWRTKSGTEVDFVVYGNDGIVAIEVKNASKIRNRDLRGLSAFGYDYPEARCYVLYRGNLRYREGSITIVPCEAFFSSLHPSSHLSAALDTP